MEPLFVAGIAAVSALAGRGFGWLEKRDRGARSEREQYRELIDAETTRLRAQVSDLEARVKGASADLEATRARAARAEADASIALAAKGLAEREAALLRDELSRSNGARDTLAQEVARIERELEATSQALGEARANATGLEKIAGALRDELIAERERAHALERRLREIQGGAL